jgi:hypothetical protein
MSQIFSKSLIYIINVMVYVIVSQIRKKHLGKFNNSKYIVNLPLQAWLNFLNASL